MTYRFLLSWRWLGIFLMAALFAAICVALGNWQMDRRNQAVAEIRRVQQNYDKSPVPFEEVRQLFEVAEAEAKWTTVSVSGRYLAADQRIVRNRPNNSAPGYEVLVPFRLTSGETIAINRGWLPIGNVRSGYPDAVPAPPRGNVSAVVRIKPSEPALDRGAPAGQLASVDLPGYARQLDYPLLTGSYGVMASESPRPAEAPQPLALPSVQEGSNLSYAMQWITFGVLAFVGFGYVARQQARIAREEQEPSVATRSPARPPQQPRRRGRGEEEDDLLDRLGL
ncbi:SURF1 family cytochrome oxidase biogenesis protein [Arthrobacter sp. QXT-31]|uniref:SURF1 family cytochrome oxidase biogenesis protein n=1 Tax=Arthrobacter sp. QXT-31 TaxID=1357915 RepID=UPI0009718C80|nr:SURF1 family protein [Arthrobacter sp. QXT-31]APX00449.1 cytochrome oxidase biogenesis protein Surf1, facilitates heme A insertion [Arthrobacter sp. QXT-31]